MVIYWYWNNWSMGQGQSSLGPFSCVSVFPVPQASLCHCVSSNGRTLFTISCWTWGGPSIPSSIKDYRDIPLSPPCVGLSTVNLALLPNLGDGTASAPKCSCISFIPGQSICSMHAPTNWVGVEWGIQLQSNEIQGQDILASFVFWVELNTGLQEGSTSGHKSKWDANSLWVCYWLFWLVCAPPYHPIV